MRSIVAGFGMRIPLGKQGENLATQVQIPVVKEWKALYGEGTFQLVNKRPDEDFTYACVIHWDDEKVMWDITNTELANVGRGVCELQYYVGDVLAKSYSWVTVIVETVYEDGATPPEPWQSWVEEVLRAGSQAEEYSEEARQHAEKAAESAQEAAGYASQAAEHAQDATNSADESASHAQQAAEHVSEAEEFARQAGISADSAQAAATSMSFATFGMDENGHLVIHRAERLGLMTFALNNNTGNLEVTI